MQASAHLSTQVLNHLTNNGTFTTPTTLYLALLKTAAAFDDDTTTHAAKEVESPGVNGYVRKVITFDPEATQMSLSDVLLTYGPSTTGWSKVNGLWLVDHADLNNGNIWLQGPPTRELTAGASDSILYAIGEILAQLT